MQTVLITTVVALGLGALVAMLLKRTRPDDAPPPPIHTASFTQSNQAKLSPTLWASHTGASLVRSLASMASLRRRPSLTPLSLRRRNRSRGTTRIEAIRRIQTVGFDEGWDQSADAPRWGPSPRSQLREKRSRPAR